MTQRVLDAAESGASEVLDSEVLATVVECSVRVQLQLPEDVRLRLADAGAGALADRYQGIVSQKARSLSVLVQQQAEEAEALRARLLTWLTELDPNDPDTNDPDTGRTTTQDDELAL